MVQRRKLHPPRIGMQSALSFFLVWGFKAQSAGAALKKIDTVLLPFAKLLQYLR